MGECGTRWGRDLFGCRATPFSVHLLAPQPTGRPFADPSNCRSSVCSQDTGFRGLVLNLVPIAPGRSRVFFHVVSTSRAPPLPAIAKVFLRLKNALPAWVDHIERNLVLNSDAIILNRQVSSSRPHLLYLLRAAGIDPCHAWASR